MNYISVMAVTEAVARGQAAEKSGYTPATIGRMVSLVDRLGSSRQHAYVFETANDVTDHPLYARSEMSDVFDLPEGAIDGPILIFGPEVTVGG